MDSNNIKAIQIIDYQELSDLFVKFNSSTQNSNFFTSIIWLEHWFNFFWQENWQIHSYAFYKNEELIALAPLYIKTSDNFPFIKTLHLMGQGEPEQAEVASEYLDILIAPGHEHAVYSQLVSLISNCKIDIMVASAIFSNSHIATIMLKISGKNLTRNYVQYTLLTENFSLQSVSKNTRSRIKRSANQLSKLNAEMRWLPYNELDNLWPTLIAFHQDRWQKKGDFGAFSSDVFNLFHQSLIENHSSSVAASAIFVNSRPIAINYYLVSEDTYHFYQSGWDEQNHTKLSPGLFLHYWSILNCPNKYYDFMMGGVNNSYKAKFNADVRAMLSIIVVKSPVKLFFSKAFNKLTRLFFSRFVRK